MNKKIVNQWLMLDGERLGRLEYTGGDMFWLLGRFHPAPAFEKHRLVFETLEALWMKEDGDEAGDLLEQINGWGLTVEDEEGRVRGVTDFKINQGKFEHKLI